ncbi:MAG: hypothetical protein B7733_25265 [Myxococcales bacterium FL481]|nr:MAG: hypothetical protein B7733_25265 [Myxococcales bacterium FL481]
MTLRLIKGASSEKPGQAPGSPAAPSSTRVAPPAPPAARGTLPLELAAQLGPGEPLVWWDRKEHLSWRPVLITFAAATVLLLVVTFFAPGLWSQPWAELGKPLAVLFSPVALVLLREYTARRSVMVTDSSVIVVTASGNADRVAFRNIRRVRKDWLTGGVVLQGAEHLVRIPPTLLQATRAAIASQTTGRIRADAVAVHDPLGWLP